MGVFENIFGRTQHSKCNGCGRIVERAVISRDNKHGRRSDGLGLGKKQLFFCSPECEARQQKSEAEEPKYSVLDHYARNNAAHAYRAGGGADAATPKTGKSEEAMSYTTISIVLRIVLFLLLILGAGLDWKREHVREQVIDALRRQIASQERLIKAQDEYVEAEKNNAAAQARLAEERGRMLEVLKRAKWT